MTTALTRIVMIGGLLLSLAITGVSQTPVAMPDGNAQRTRVLATQSLDTPPQQLLWETEDLFKVIPTFPVTTRIYPFTIYEERPNNQSFSFPIVSQDIVFFTVFVVDGYFYAVDAKTGKQIITLKFDHNRLSAPAAIGQVAYFGTSSGKVYAYDVPTRSVKWIYEGKGAFTTPSIDNGVIYLSEMEEGIVALDADTGKLKWKAKADEVLLQPAVKGDDVVVYGVRGLLMSLDAKTGTRKWDTRIGRAFTGTSILDDQIFLRHPEGEIRAYALADGTLRWKSHKSGGTETALALFKDSVIYGEEYGNVVALDAGSGAQKWKFKTNKGCRSPIIAGETLYTTCEHFIYALNANNGELKWKLDGKKSGPLPTINDGVLYFLAGRGVLQAVK